MKRALVLAALAASLVVTGCTSSSAMKEPTYKDASKDQFLTSNRAAIDKLVSGLHRNTYGNAPILVATIVDVNNVQRSAPLGRTLAEQYSSQLVVRGYNVKELKLRSSVFVQEGTGELMLSREIKDIAKLHNASLVLVGTYSAASSTTYVNIKLVRTEDGKIVRGYDYVLPNDRNVSRLLRTKR